jgi:hypothetical protein
MKNAGAFVENHLNLGIKTTLNGTLTSNIVIDTSQVATDTLHRPERPYRKLYPMATRGQFPVPATRPLRAHYPNPSSALARQLSPAADKLPHELCFDRVPILLQKDFAHPGEQH